MFRVWFKDKGEVDCCKIKANTKEESLMIFKEALPNAKVGFVEEI